MEVPEFTEFRNAVYKIYKKRTVGMSEDVSERYFESDEAQNEINNAYIYNRERLKDGIITERIFMGDSAAGVAYCLSMMCE